MKNYTFNNVTNVKKYISVDLAIKRIKEIYEKSCNDIYESYKKFINKSNDTVVKGYYPYLGIKIDNEHLQIDSRLSFGSVDKPGIYGTTLTRPDLFSNYYHEQISLIMKHHDVPVYVGISDVPIPLPFVTNIADYDISNLDFKEIDNIKLNFNLPNIRYIDDSIINGNYNDSNTASPLAPFSAERVDFSLNRLHHYTGTSPEHFQNFILFTNYQRYIKEFILYARNQIESGKEFSSIIGPGDIAISDNNFSIPESSTPQMPAYHLKCSNNKGISFINIGVGPSNAKTITDHLSVLRPHCWIMLGHCAGLRSNQILGDYVLAHAYVREDRVMEYDLPSWVPLPALAEIQQALQGAVANITHQEGFHLKKRMRTGTVFTTDNRNWELRSKELFLKFKQSRAIAVDMESATLAANGFRYRVPYGTLLCVSDKPIHGEIKLKNMARQFYQKRINQHLKIGIEAIKIIKERGEKEIHSRKLRNFDEPPFR